MATRSLIAISNNNGSFEAIYCHWDGYPRGVGKVLFEHYTDYEKIRKLIYTGDVSSFDENGVPNHYTEGNTEKVYCKDYDDLMNLAYNVCAEFVYMFSADIGWQYVQYRPGNNNYESLAEYFCK